MELQDEYCLVGVELELQDFAGPLGYDPNDFDADGPTPEELKTFLDSKGLDYINNEEEWFIGLSIELMEDSETLLAFKTEIAGIINKIFEKAGVDWSIEAEELGFIYGTKYREDEI